MLAQSEKGQAVSSPLQPSMRLLVTLGSIAIYAERQRLGPLNVEDYEAFRTLSNDAELATWLEQMDRLAFLPVKR